MIPSTVKTIRGYEIYENLGAGGFGAVYRAVQPSVGREVAIKVILPEYANHPDFIRRFEVEAQLIAHLEHPHIVPLYDYWREPDGAFLVMRYLRGGSLRAALQRGAWMPEAAARLLDQIAGALTVAHRQGVIHRDVKPENILLDEEGNAYLSDFGIAKEVSRAAAQTETGMVTGSLAYISPELAQSKPPAAPSDLYSLGVVMYEVLTGEHPFPNLPPTAQLFKHLTESLPSLWSKRSDLPEGLDAVIQCVTAKDPAERYPDALSFAAAFRAALGAVVTPAITPLPPELTPLQAPNPYKGLRAFSEADADDFFGREALTQQLLARLGEVGSPLAGQTSIPQPLSRFLAIVGPSGSGKSSLVKAGVIPALRRGALPGSEKWFILEMLPGAHPLEELEIGLLRIAARQPGGLMEQLRRDERGLLRAARLVLPNEHSELLLVVDQFEELFTLAEDKAEVAHFLNHLYAVAADPRSRMRVMVTLRADFYDRPLTYPDFSTLIQKRTEVVVPLTAEELAAAIQKPAEQAGAVFDSGLVAAIVADVKDQPGALPLLQYALTELFERRAGRLLTRKAYGALGGVLGVLGRRAEEVFASLDAAGQSAARQMFLRLVTLGEGTEDTRRRVLRSELESLSGAESPTQHATRGSFSAIGQAIEVFGGARLLSFDRDLLTRSPTVEVAHEALLREWKRLREWLDSSRADVRQQRLLANAATEWLNAARDASFLLHGARLSQFEGWAAGSELALTQDERTFLASSLAERRAELAAEQAREQRELEAARQIAATAQQLAETEKARAEAEKRRAEEQTLAARRLRHRAIYLTFSYGTTILLLAVTLWFGQLARGNAAVALRHMNNAQAASTQAIAAQSTAEAERARADSEMHLAMDAQATAEAERARAEQEALNARSHEWAAAAISNLEKDPELSIKLALQAISAADTYDAENALHQAIQAARIRFTLWGHSDEVLDVDFSPDGTKLATTSVDKTIKLWDVASGRELFTLKGHTEEIWYSIFSPDGTRLASASKDHTAKVWDTTTGKELLTLSGHNDLVWDIAFSPDGTRLATASADMTAKVWDATTGRELFTLNETAAIALSPDGRRMATGWIDGTAKIREAATGESLFTLSGHTDSVYLLVFSPDGKRLATSGYDNLTTLWEVETGEKLLTLDGYGVTFSPDGTRLATWGGDGTVATVYDTTTGQKLHTLSGHTAGGNSFAFSADGKILATGSSDGTAKVWDVETGKELFILAGHTAAVNVVAISPGCVAPPQSPFAMCGRYLATSSRDGTAKVWDISPAGNRELLTAPGVAATFNADGTVMNVINLISANELSVQGWQVSPEIESRLTFSYTITHPARIVPGAFSSDQTRMVSASTDGTVNVWELASGRNLRTFTVPGEIMAVIGVDDVPAGVRLVTTSAKGTATVWDVMSGQKLLTLSGLPNPLVVVAFSPDGSRLATIGEDEKTADIWDTATGEKLFTLNGHTQPLYWVDFSPDGTRLVTASKDATAMVWYAESGARLLTLSGHSASVGFASFSSDGEKLATASYDGTVKVWDAITGQELLTLTGHSGWVSYAAFSPDGKRLASGSIGDWTARGYVLPLADLVKLAQERLKRSLSETPVP